MSNPDNSYDVIVIGAGISGIMAAWQLGKLGLNVAIVEKSKGVGGRMATRRVGPGVADTGAQFFTIRSPIFQAIASEWLAAGLLFEWSRGWVNNELQLNKKDGYPRYAVHGGMTAVAKMYRPDMNIHTNVLIEELSATANSWKLTAKNGQTWTSRAVISTAPIPQALAICNAGYVPLSTTDRAALSRITYGPCLCGIYWLDGTTNLPQGEALQRPDHDFSWIADNQSKGISPQAQIITMHMHPDRSATLYEEPDEVILPLFDAELAQHFSPKLVVLERQIKRWRYALPLVTHPDRTLLAANLPPLAFAGDAFNGPRIEGAVLSGLAAAQEVHQSLAQPG